MGALQGKDWCVKAIYNKEEVADELQELLFTFPEYPWEIRYCDICNGFHIWKDYMREHG